LLLPPLFFRRFAAADASGAADAVCCFTMPASRFYAVCYFDTAYAFLFFFSMLRYADTALRLMPL